jgi:hypothetical protein
MEINFTNGYRITSLEPISLNKRSTSNYIGYHCNNCNTFHWLLMSDSTIVDGQWVCKKSQVNNK